MPAVETANHLGRLGTSICSAQISLEPICKLVMVFCALLSSHGFHGRSKQVLIALAARPHKIN